MYSEPPASPTETPDMSQVPPSVPPPPSQPPQPPRPSREELDSFFAPEPRRANALAVVSLITGILACVPFVTGIAAIVTGILGLKKASDPRVGGRGLAITGLVLGVLSVLFWALFGTGIWGLFKATEEPRKLAATFVRDVAAGDFEAAQAAAGPLVTPGEIRELSDTMAGWGTFKQLTSFRSSIQTRPGQTECQLGGTAEFSQETKAFEMTVTKINDEWKVTYWRFE
jgi:hypothetical protein